MSYLSGLVSMWLGFSALAFFEGIERAGEKLYKYLVEKGHIEGPSPAGRWRATGKAINMVRRLSHMNTTRRNRAKFPNYGANYARQLTVNPILTPIAPRPVYVPELKSSFPSYTDYSVPEIIYKPPAKKKSN